MKQRVEEIEKDFDIKPNRVVYMATSPKLFLPAPAEEEEVIDVEAVSDR